MEEVSCNLCGGENTELLFSGKDWVFPTNEEFNIVRCKKCGLVFLNPRPGKDEIVKYYPDEYYGKGKKKGNEPYPFLKPKRVNMTKKYIKSGKVLDIGSQRGGFLLELGEEGFEPYGVELSEYACEYAKTLGLKNVIHGDVEEIKLEDNFFNGVTLRHVLEHIYDPQKLLYKVNKSIKSNGLLVIEVPNFGSLPRRVFKEKWYALDAPRHLYQFTESTLSEMLRKAGFKVIKKSYRDNFSSNFASFRVSLLRISGLEKISQNRGDKILENRWYRGILKCFFNWFCIIFSLILAYLRSSDIITIYSRKE